LISASTCAAAVPPWAAGGLAGAEAAADADGLALAVAVAAGRGDGEREDGDADGPLPAWRGGSVTTAGDAAMAMPAGVPAQGPVAAPHPAVVARGLAVVRPDAGPGESTPRAR
jgi:hypothetical protein